MLTADRFADRLEARLWYLIDQPADLAGPELLEQLRSGRWHVAPDAWMTAARNIGREQGLSEWTKARLITELARTLMEGRVTDDEPAHTVLVETFREAANLPPGATCGDLLADLAGWFERVAGPGDAALAAEALSQIGHRDGDGGRAVYLARIYPLVRWLLDHGAAELRRRERAHLLIMLVEAVLACDPARIEVALGYTLANEAPGQVWFMDDGALLWAAVEAALERGATASFVAGIAQELPISAWGVDKSLLPWMEGSAFPRSAGALVQILFAGMVRGDVLTGTWRHALRHVRPPDDLCVTTRESIDKAIEVLKEDLPFKRESVRTPNLRAWMRRITCDYARIHDIAGPHVGAVRARDRLQRLHGHDPEATLGMHDGLVEALSESPTTATELARAILSEADRRATVRAALHALPPVARGPAGAGPDAEALADLRELLERIIHAPWLEPVAGVRLRDVLGGVRRVAFDDLDREDKVRITGDVVFAHLPVVSGIAKIRDIERRRALAALYFLHELVHLHQGIGDKEVVTRVRSTGAETTLLHMDLAADHAAAVMAPRAVRCWTTESLKDLQGHSQAKYPATWMHTQPSRARKAIRVVSLRLDYLLRAAGRPVLPEDGYAFVDHGPAGGELLAMVSGPPPRVLRAAKLAGEDARVLAAVADEGQGDERGIARVDEILRRLLLGAKS